MCHRNDENKGQYGWEAIYLKLLSLLVLSSALCSEQMKLPCISIQVSGFG